MSEWDEKKDPKAREQELDRFWDIDALIPKKRAPIYPANTDTAELILEPPTATPSGAQEEGKVAKPQPLPPAEEPERHYIPPHSAATERKTDTPDESYAPSNALLRCVRLYRWKNEYRYYEAFVRDAIRLYPIRGKEAPRAHFFSYVPQYSQLSLPQLEWYLWWRENMRKGVALDTDYSYLLLYTYELINLAENIGAQVAREALFTLWISYRQTFRQLDGYLPEWICDMGLIHRLPPPKECRGKYLAAAMSHCALREYYVCYDGARSYAHALLAFCSNYDYHKSKFYTEENAPLFDQAVVGALQEISDKTSEDGKLFSMTRMDDSKMLRDAYSGALCSYRFKRKIEVEYCSFSRSHELRFLVTDLVKYTENQIRAALGIRSRLTVNALPTEIKPLLDAYLEGILPKRSRILPRPEPVAEYERQYDLPRTPLSLAAADEIEERSWSVTRRLVEAFEEENEVPPIPPALPTEPVDPPSALEELPTEALPFAPYRAFLRAALEGNGQEQERLARATGTLTDGVADAINTLAADLFGDVLLEDADGCYTVIEDYRSLAEDLLKTLDGKEE